MNLSHRRSASTATENVNTSDLLPHRLRNTGATGTPRGDAPSSSPNSLSPHQHRPRRRDGDEQHSNSGSDMTSSDDLELDDFLSDDEAGRLEDDEETGLTSGDRRKRRKRKRRNTLLDQRVVPDGVGGPSSVRREEEERLANATFWWKVIVNTSLIALWYFFSISITLYNKWMFKSEDKEPDIVFPFPLFTTCVHMIVQFTLASLVLYFFPRFRPRHDSINPHAPLHAQRMRPISPPDHSKPIMTRWFYLTRIGPCGAATGLDIGLGNMSLKFISMTFYTMCKSSVLGFVLLFAFLFRLEKPSVKLFLTIATMTAGVLLMVAGETAFDPLGFLLVMTAAASSGFRWSLTQILLIRNPATSNPFATLFFLAPVMFVTLLVLAIPVEGFLALSEALHTLAETKGYWMSLGILLFPGTLAFMMTASEFALLQRTSVVTLSICGIFKEVLTITAGTLVFKDRLTPINFAGLAVTIVTIAVYNWMKIRKMREESERAAHLALVGGEDGAGSYAPVRVIDEYDEGSERFTEQRRNHGRGRSGGSDTLRPGAGSLGDVIRNSLSLGRGSNEASPTTKSPVKKPENLE
ncbi:uncharacterized protein PV09_05781 [Verruconis gallopava]|uniref:Sugar phosphate transporter domain-containing protein n=1 Tax=Verruconis gallopava TaxID=253628 RepID=A0A0D2AVH3_9PEZI|nr:uncharacterized protein PV09_05781 [Verruconis gallopava]KIW03139.1 hypothetical protein PV09_05781 [Verruconis gallopava]